jgi:DNA-binding NarL/FixJ family response regulator
MGTATGTTVFIVEDSPSIRASLVEMLNALDGVKVVGDADTPSDAVAGILQTHPDFAVLDYQLKGGTAVDVLRAVHAKLPATAFLVLTNHANPQYRRICLEAGASCFFDKSLEFHRVKEVIAAADMRRPA